MEESSEAEVLQVGRARASSESGCCGQVEVFWRLEGEGRLGSVGRFLVTRFAAARICLGCLGSRNMGSSLVMELDAMAVGLEGLAGTPCHKDTII